MGSIVNKEMESKAGFGGGAGLLLGFDDGRDGQQTQGGGHGDGERMRKVTAHGTPRTGTGPPCVTAGVEP